MRSAGTDRKSNKRGFFPLFFRRAGASGEASIGGTGGDSNVGGASELRDAIDDTETFINEQAVDRLAALHAVDDDDQGGGDLARGEARKALTMWLREVHAKPGVVRQTAVKFLARFSLTQ